MLIGGPTHTYVVDSGIMGVLLVATLILEVPENQQTAGVGYQYLSLVHGVFSNSHYVTGPHLIVAIHNIIPVDDISGESEIVDVNQMNVTGVISYVEPF
jgi:hypothetical protein